MRQPCLAEDQNGGNDHGEINNLKSAATEKLRLDFALKASMCTGMQLDPPHQHHKVIASLCLEAGRIMEDESTDLALTLPASAASIAVRLATARQAGEDIAALAAAAQVLLRRRKAGF